jgi:hypothetical protein
MAEAISVRSNNHWRAQSRGSNAAQAGQGRVIGETAHTKLPCHASDQRHDLNKAAAGDEPTAPCSPLLAVPPAKMPEVASRSPVTQLEWPTSPRVKAPDTTTQSMETRRRSIEHHRAQPRAARATHVHRSRLIA